MKKICVYTCITGDYDNVHEVKKKETGVDYLLFTNNKSVVSNSWQVVYIEDPNLDNQRLSRKIKMLGHPIIDQNYEISVWQDASVVFQKSVVTFVQTYLKNNSFAAFLHHVRDCIYDEAMACIKKKKDKKEVKPSGRAVKGGNAGKLSLRSIYVNAAVGAENAAATAVMSAALGNVILYFLQKYVRTKDCKSAVNAEYGESNVKINAGAVAGWGTLFTLGHIANSVRRS